MLSFVYSKGRFYEKGVRDNSDNFIKLQVIFFKVFPEEEMIFCVSETQYDIKY